MHKTLNLLTFKRWRQKRRRKIMPVIFREKEREYKEKWLPDYFGDRLETIRRLVKHLHMSKEKIPQVKWFTPHGAPHCQAVEDLLHHLIPDELYCQLTEDERFFLLSSAWLHDIGMIRGIMGEELESVTDEQIREEHHTRSEQFIIRNYREIGVEEPEKEAFGLLSRYHRRRCPLIECPEEINIPNHNSVRLRLLAAYLRLADALHIDQTRAPDAQYAISLAYDIPSKSKLHWLRSKFVLGIDVSVEKKEISVHLKSPINEIETHGNKPNAMERTLESIYDLIVQDLAAELDTVKDVLFAANISYFLRITKKVHKVVFDQQLLRDIKSVFNYYFLLDNPSSSSLYTLMLQSIREIIESYSLNIHENKQEVEQAALKAVSSFLDEIDERVLGSRKCHTGLRNFVKKIRDTVKQGNVIALQNEIQFRSWLLERKRTGVRFSAYRYFNKKLASNVWKKEVDPPIKPFNILLYGYSELVIKSLCGFRDAVISRLLNPYHQDIEEVEEYTRDIYPWTTDLKGIDEESGMRNVHDQLSQEQRDAPPRDDGSAETYGPGKRLPLLHKSRLEQRASKWFNIFVCEGQPKNRTTWGGKTIYHDGSRFAITLANHGFTEIFVIPDAVASSLIAPYDQGEGFPRIHFVMVGANGYDKDKFLHSAGHAMVAAITSYARHHWHWNEGCSDDETELPALILSIITDKYKIKKIGATGKSASDSTSSSYHKKGNIDSPVIVTDGWKFREAFAREPIRTHVFISQDQELRSSLNNEAPTALFYNPREDRIPISCVDVVITEKAWLEKKTEKKFKNDWNGDYITIRDQDSSSLEQNNKKADKNIKNNNKDINKDKNKDKNKDHDKKSSKENNNKK